MPAVLEHVPAVQRPGLLDAGDAVAVGAHRGLGRLRLAAALVGAGTGDHREVAVDDHRVLDEDRVGQLVGGGDLGRGPAGRVQRVDVRLPLALRELDVDLAALDVGDQSVSQP